MKKLSVIFLLPFLLGGGKSFSQSSFQVPVDTLAPLPLSYQKLFLQQTYMPAENFEIYHNDINYPILIGMGTALTGVVGAITHYYATTWWKDQSTAFHIQND